MLKVREGAWPAFLHCIFLRLWKQGLQSIVAPCQPKSNETSTERKIRMPNHSRPSCIWATHPQTGNPGEGSGSLEILSTPRSETMLRIYENGAAAAAEQFWKAKSRSLINPQKVSFPCLAFLLKGFLTSGQRKIQSARLKLGLHLVTSHNLSLWVML